MHGHVPRACQLQYDEEFGFFSIPRVHAVKEAVYGRPSFGDFIDGPRHRRTTRDQRAPASAQTEKEKGNGEEKKGREKADTAIHDYVT